MDQILVHKYYKNLKNVFQNLLHIKSFYEVVQDLNNDVEYQDLFDLLVSIKYYNNTVNIY